MFPFSPSRLFPSWFSPLSKPPNPALSVDNVMDEHTPRSVEPNPSLNKTKQTEAEQDQDRESEASGGLFQLRRCDDEGCGPRQRFRYG
jgi:hypothetical protein